MSKEPAADAGDGNNEDNEEVVKQNTYHFQEKEQGSGQQEGGDEGNEETDTLNDVDSDVESLKLEVRHHEGNFDKVKSVKHDKEADYQNFDADETNDGFIKDEEVGSNGDEDEDDHADEYEDADADDI